MQELFVPVAFWFTSDGCHVSAASSAYHAALMAGTSYDRVFIDGTAELLPNYTLEKLMHGCFEEVGVPKCTAEELEYAA